MLDLLNHPRVRQLLTLAFLTGALVCMFPLGTYPMKWWARHAEHITLGYLALGLVFLVLNNSRLMFVCFGCSAAISFFLSEKTNPKIKDATPTDMPFVKVAHFNVNSSEGQVADFMQSILAREADVIALEEVTPGWDSVLIHTLGPQYPHYSCISGLVNGLAVFSRFPLVLVDTFYYQEMPNLAVSLRPEDFDRDIWVINSLTKPPLSGSSFESLKGHLERISFFANKVGAPVVTVGDYNSVSWSPEIIEFRKATRLSDSRRGIKPTEPDGRFPLFNVPVDHIFYSTDFFDCLRFETISNPHNDHIGIESVLQMKAKAPVIMDKSMLFW
ncbi:MAG: endonuclease/exonuclease/phosphatase family protein [Saprospiraceae bacterium]